MRRESFLQIKIPALPIGEQRAILSKLRAVRERAGPIIGRAGRLLDDVRLLRERMADELLGFSLRH
jgi:hypothetical protein